MSRLDRSRPLERMGQADKVAEQQRLDAFNADQGWIDSNLRAFGAAFGGGPTMFLGRAVGDLAYTNDPGWKLNAKDLEAATDGIDPDLWNAYARARSFEHLQYLQGVNQGVMDRRRALTDSVSKGFVGRTVGGLSDPAMFAVGFATGGAANALGGAVKLGALGRFALAGTAAGLPQAALTQLQRSEDPSITGKDVTKSFLGGAGFGVAAGLSGGRSLLPRIALGGFGQAIGPAAADVLTGTPWGNTVEEFAHNWMFGGMFNAIPHGHAPSTVDAPTNRARVLERPQTMSDAVGADLERTLAALKLFSQGDLAPAFPSSFHVAGEWDAAMAPLRSHQSELDLLLARLDLEKMGVKATPATRMKPTTGGGGEVSAPAPGMTLLDEILARPRKPDLQALLEQSRSLTKGKASPPEWAASTEAALRASIAALDARDAAARPKPTPAPDVTAGFSEAAKREIDLAGRMASVVPAPAEPTGRPRQRFVYRPGSSGDTPTRTPFSIWTMSDGHTPTPSPKLPEPPPPPAPPAAPHTPTPPPTFRLETAGQTLDRLGQNFAGDLVVDAARQEGRPLTPAEAAQHASSVDPERLTERVQVAMEATGLSAPPPEVTIEERAREMIDQGEASDMEEARVMAEAEARAVAISNPVKVGSYKPAPVEPVAQPETGQRTMTPTRNGMWDRLTELWKNDPVAQQAAAEADVTLSRQGESSSASSNSALVYKGPNEPGEIAQAFEGTPWRRMFRAAKPGEKAGFEDFIATHGIDKLAQMLRANYGNRGEAYNRTARTEVMRWALDAKNASVPPEARFIAQLLDGLSSSDVRIFDRNVAFADAKDIQAGSTFKIADREFRVIEGEDGGKVIADGAAWEDVPAEHLSGIPYERGSLRLMTEEEMFNLATADLGAIDPATPLHSAELALLDELDSWTNPKPKEAREALQQSGIQKTIPVPEEPMRAPAAEVDGVKLASPPKPPQGGLFGEASAGGITGKQKPLMDVAPAEKAPPPPKVDGETDAQYKARIDALTKPDATQTTMPGVAPELKKPSWADKLEAWAEKQRQVKLPRGKGKGNRSGGTVLPNQLAALAADAAAKVIRAGETTWDGIVKIVQEVAASLKLDLSKHEPAVMQHVAHILEKGGLKVEGAPTFFPPEDKTAKQVLSPDRAFNLEDHYGAGNSVAPSVRSFRAFGVNFPFSLGDIAGSLGQSKSPLMRMIGRIVAADPLPGADGSPSYHAVEEKVAAKVKGTDLRWDQEVESLWHDRNAEARKSGGKPISLQQFREDLGRAMRRADAPADSWIGKAKAAARGMFDELGQMMIDHGLDVSLVKDYLPRLWNREAIDAAALKLARMGKPEAAFEDSDLVRGYELLRQRIEESILAKGEITDPEDAAAKAQSIIDHGGIRDGYEGDDGVTSGYTNRLKERITLDETYSWKNADGSSMSIEDLISSDAFALFKAYSRGAIGSSALAEVSRMVSVNPDMSVDRLNGVRQIITRLRQDATAVGLTGKKLAAQVENARVVLHGIAQIPVHKETGLGRVLDNTRRVINIRLMSGFGTAMTQMGESIGQMGAHGAAVLEETVPALRAVVEAARAGEISKRDAQLMVECGVGVDRIASKIPDRMGDDTGNPVHGSRGEHIIRKIERAAYDVGGISWGTDAGRLGQARAYTRQWVEAATAGKVVTDANGVRSWQGELPAERRLALDTLTPGMARRIMLQLATPGRVVYGDHGLIDHFNFGAWDDPAARRAFIDATQRNANRNILELPASGLHRFFATPLGKVFVQFRRMSLAPQWTTAPELYARDTQTVTTLAARSVGAVLSFVGFTALSAVGRKDRKEFLADRLSWDHVAKAAFSRALYASFIPTAVDTLWSDVGRQDPVFSFARTTGLQGGFLLGNPTIDLARKLGLPEDPLKLPRAFAAPLIPGYDFSQADLSTIQRTVLPNITGLAPAIDRFVKSRLPEQSVNR